MAYPTDAEIAEARVARDWAGIEIHDRDPDGECDGALRARAIRALREGRAAYLHVSTYGGLPTLWASIACDHGEAIADIWIQGEAPRDVADWYGPRWPNRDFSALMRVRSAVKVIEPRRVREAA